MNDMALKRSKQSKPEEPIIEEMRSLLPYYAVANAAYFLVIIVLFFALKFDYTLIVGAIYGNILTVANFFLLGKSAQKALRRTAKSAQTYMNTMYCLRYLGLFVLLAIAAVTPFVNLIAAIIPLFFPKIIITIRALREKDE